MNFKLLFNKYKAPELISKKRKYICDNFLIACDKLTVVNKRKPKNFLWSNNHHNKTGYQNQLEGWRKNEMGYRGIGYNSGVWSKISTEQTTGKLAKELTKDHVVGVTLCGQIVEEMLENNTLQYLIKNWLLDNLYLWGTIRMTKEEHHKDNVIQDQHTLKEKINFKHYKNINFKDLIIPQK